LLGEAHDRVSKSRAHLRERGFGDELLQDAAPVAIDVIKTLVARIRIGALRNKTIDSEGKLKILFMATNPRETTQLDLEEELRAITLELRGTRYRERIELSARHAVRADDLLRYIRGDAPDVLHFSGHGTTEGIVLRDDAGGYRVVRGEALCRLLSTTNQPRGQTRNLELLLLG
jgi:hypothetical protein